MHLPARTTRTLATAALAAGVVLSTSSAALAQTVDHDDVAGDVMSQVVTDDDTSSPTVAQPTVQDGDVTHVRIVHGTRNVRVRVRYADLTKKSDFAGQFADLRTNEKVRRSIVLSAEPGAWRGEVEVDRPNGKAVRCKTSHSIDYQANVATVSIPRSCLSSPRWVRVGVGQLHAVATSDTEETLYADDGFADANDPFAGALTLSRRVHRG